MTSVEPTASAKLKRAIRPLFAAFAVLFLVHTAFGLYERWDGQPLRVQFLPAALAFCFAGLAMVLQWLGWRGLVEKWSGHRMPAGPSARLYMDSQMARYTPGKIGLPAVRISGASAVGVPGSVMAATLIAELLSWVASGSLLGGLFLSLVPRASELSEHLSGLSVLLSSGALVGLLLCVLVKREKLPSKLRKLAGADGSGALIPWRLPLWHLAHFLSWTACGALFCSSVGGDLQSSLIVGALLCLAIVLGFVALLAPAGAGVREAVIVVGATPLLGPTAALSVSLLTRVASLASDVLLWIAVRFFKR